MKYIRYTVISDKYKLKCNSKNGLCSCNFLIKNLRICYSAFTETGATQTMKTNQNAELKQ